MQFQIPQFIEVEDKIFGPLTFKQFVYLAGGAGLAVVFFAMLPIYIAVVLALPVIALAAALAFYRVNSRPLIEVIESAVSYFLSSKLYLWKMRERKTDQAKAAQQERAREPLMKVPKISESKLRDLAWSLDVHESIYADTADVERRR